MGYLRSLPRVRFVVASPSRHAGYNKTYMFYFSVTPSDPLGKLYMSLWYHYFVEEGIAPL